MIQFEIRQKSKEEGQEEAGFGNVVDDVPFMRKRKEMY